MGEKRLEIVFVKANTRSYYYSSRFFATGSIYSPEHGSTALTNAYSISRNDFTQPCKMDLNKHEMKTDLLY